ncbi:unnamed protein product [Rhodiola kirilowii]
MDSLASFITPLLLLVPFLIFYLKKKGDRRLPPGSLGLPIIGQSLSLLRAMRSNTEERWLKERAERYGPVSKLSLFGCPTVFLSGQEANKFIYTCDGSVLGSQQPASLRRITGERNLLELSGGDHKRLRGALMSFLKPEVLKQYVGKMDQEIQSHMDLHWHGKDKVQVMPLVKTLTFDLICTLIFGIGKGHKRDELQNLSELMIAGILAVPVNFPFTRFNCSLKASLKMKSILKNLVMERRKALNENKSSPYQDLISCLVTLTNDDNVTLLSDEEIVDNAILVMLAGHDTSSILITFLVRLFAMNPSVYDSVVREQEDIARNKASDELLTWEDLAKMKYTWRVAVETLRMTPPVFTSFRKVLKDIDYGGYTLPKGWQVVWAMCVTQKDDNIFPDSETFDPSRFENQAPPPPYSFLAFGAGPRMCPGNEFARIETLSTIHYLVTRFTWKLCSEDNRYWRDPMPVFSEGLPIQIQSKSSK